MHLLDHVVVPIADRKDAVATAEALNPHLHSISRVTAVHVIEKRSGIPDKAPVEKRQRDAAHFLSVFDTHLDKDVDIDVQTSFGNDVADQIIETAVDAEATAIAFHPRGGSRLVRLLTGSTAARLVGNGVVPVVSLSRRPQREGLRKQPPESTDGEVRG
ncbi:universal stress protein [Haloferax sp. DFSO60]|uniref:universal stress protein n=1 Tax=Haloferax sp. DFSO60 TaxID=3388652 RepID=UPI00397B62AB